MAELDLLEPSAAPALSAPSAMPVAETPAAPDQSDAAPQEAAQADAAAVATDDTAKEAEAGDAAPKEPRGVGKKLAEQQAQIEAERGRAEKALSDLQAAQAELAKLKVPTEAKPDRAQFDSPDAYDAALESWGKAQGEYAAAERRAHEQREVARKATVEAWQARVEAAKAEFPDFEVVALAETVPITVTMGSAIAVATNGPAVAYHLGKNIQEAQRIASMPPAQQGFEIGQLAARLEREGRAKISRAPNPIERVGSRMRAVEKTPEDMSMDEYAAQRERQLFPKRFASQSAAVH